MTITPTTGTYSDFTTAGRELSTVVQVSGDLDHATVPQVADRLHAAVTSGPAEVVVDLENCTFVDATALAKLVETNTAAQRSGRTLVLRCCSPRVERLLAITGLRRVFTVRD